MILLLGDIQHDLINGITPGQNLITSPRGEPVLITQVEKDGRYFGILTAIFDSKGVLKSAVNNINKTTDWQKNYPKIEELKDKYLGKAVPIGVLTKDCKTEGNFISENALGNLATDALRYKSGAQIALMNPAKIRCDLNKGIITTRDIDEIFSIKNKAYKIELTEPDIISVLTAGAQSTKNGPPYRPGLIQVSGIKYTVSPSKTIKDIAIENPDGTLTKIDPLNPNPNKKYSVVYDEFMFTGAEGMTALNKPDKIIKTYDWSEDDAVKDYLKSFNNVPIQIITKNRITVEK